jgi:hypothetical protein
VSDFVDTWLFVEHDQPGWLPPGRDGEVTAAWEECLAAAAVADGQAANGQPAAVDVPPAPPPPPPAPPRPRWDLANRTLYLGDKVACRFQREAPRLFALLDLFEERGWPQTADCPRDFPAKNTVDNLNKKVAAAQLRFGRTDGDARVTWLLLTS